ncbi:SDR family NAD(P)-dependent oxidoreductase [Streptomyces durhamensis]|uniref:SDR family NAD(P)-dependent oxidoreductase n=1 Tax=Streptomyces durhamensis TaxID=68194 RepID=UPI0012FF0D71
MSVRDPNAGQTGADQGVTAAGAGVADRDAPSAGCAALVTGASDGAGAATASSLPRQSAAAAVTARRTGRLEDPAAVIHDRAGSCRVLTAALGDAAQARRAIEDAVDRFTRSATPAGRSPPLGAAGATLPATGTGRPPVACRGALGRMPRTPPGPSPS